jgi:alkylation response protein AidB-like acyl-CoA dehydrogenase
MGFTWENDIHLYYRRAKASETMLGDATFHRERIARTVVDRRSTSTDKKLATDQHLAVST